MKSYAARCPLARFHGVLSETLLFFVNYFPSVVLHSAITVPNSLKNSEHFAITVTIFEGCHDPFLLLRWKYSYA
jgi:hypothetical protein